MADTFKKEAVDSKAKEYWSSLWAEYGEALTRDIPRRIKSALVADKKIASVVEAAQILPIAQTKENDRVLIEGIYRDASTKTKLMFQASLDKEGNIESIRSFQLK
jgi:hypothetical protein